MKASRLSYFPLEEPLAKNLPMPTDPSNRLICVSLTCDDDRAPVLTTMGQVPVLWLIRDHVAIQKC